MSATRPTTDVSSPFPTTGPRRVLVVGAGSLFGRAVVQALVHAGHMVVAQTPPGEPLPSWPELLVTRWDHDPFAPLAPDLDVPPADVVIGALPVRRSEGHPEELRSLSEGRTRRALQLADRASASRIVILSGIEAMGPRSPEEDVGYEGPEIRPVLHVGGALHAAEELGRLWADAAPGRSWIVLRAGHVFGPGEPGFLDQVSEILLGPDRDVVRKEWANRRFQPVHIDDVGVAASLAVTRGDGVYHITNGSCPTVGHIIRDLEGVARLKGLDVPRVPAPQRPMPSPERIHYAYPPDRARRDLGFEPRWTLSSGMARLVDELQHNGTGVKRSWGFARLVLQPEESPGETTRRVSRAGRFWDEHGTVADLLYKVPHEWAYDEELGRTLQAPVLRFLGDTLRRADATRVLDLACGTGGYSRHLCKELGIETIGVDPSAEKVAYARELAASEGLEGRARFEEGDLLTWKADTPVDAICAIGALRHFPDLQQHLPGILARNLRPGGLVIAVEPYCEAGYHPSLLRFMRSAMSSWFGRLFDVARYEAAAGEPRRGRTPLRPEPSPESFDLDGYLRDHFDPVRMRYTHFLSPFVANAFVMYQRSSRLRRAARFAMPAIVRLDDYFCRFHPFRRWAALGLYAVRARGLEPR